MKKILCICMSSTIQRTVSFDAITLEKVNRSKHYRQDASGKAVNSARVLEQLESQPSRGFPENAGPCWTVLQELQPSS